MSEIKTVVDGVVDAIVYPSITDKTKNRGFAFVEFESHRAAAIARRKLIPGHVLLWGQPIAVDWAEPEQEVDEDIMSKVSTCRLTQNPSVMRGNGNGMEWEEPHKHTPTNHQTNRGKRKNIAYLVEVIFFS